jgi:hypothetical protein
VAAIKLISGADSIRHRNMKIQFQYYSDSPIAMSEAEVVEWGREIFEIFHTHSLVMYQYASD